MEGAEVSKLLANKWKSLPKEEQVKWYTEAERLKKLHQAQFPNYKYNPKSKPKKLSMKQSVAKLDPALVPLAAQRPLIAPAPGPPAAILTPAGGESSEFSISIPETGDISIHNITTNQDIIIPSTTQGGQEFIGVPHPGQEFLGLPQLTPLDTDSNVGLPIIITTTANNDENTEVIELSSPIPPPIVELD